MRLPQLTPLAVGAFLMFAGQGMAQDSASNPQQRQLKTATKAPDTQSALPEFLMKVKLTPQQEQQIRQVINTHDQKAKKVWEDFQQMHWQTVALEASLSATNALEGHDHAAHHEGEAAPPKDNRQPNLKNPGFTPNQQDQPRKADPTAAHDRDKAHSANSEQEKEVNILSMRVVVLEPNGKVREIQLAGNTPRHEDTCEICAAQEKELKTMWGKVRDLHYQLVQIEASRMIAIESKLTEEQLEALQKDHPFQTSQNKNQKSEQPEAGARRQIETRKESGQ